MATTTSKEHLCYNCGAFLRGVRCGCRETKMNDKHESATSPFLTLTAKEREYTNRLATRASLLRARLRDSKLRDTQEIKKELHALDWALNRFDTAQREAPVSETFKPYDQAALDEASRELHMFLLREGSSWGTKACEEFGRIFMTTYLKALPATRRDIGKEIIAGIEEIRDARTPTEIGRDLKAALERDHDKHSIPLGDPLTRPGDARREDGATPSATRRDDIETAAKICDEYAAETEQQAMEERGYWTEEAQAVHRAQKELAAAIRKLREYVSPPVALRCPHGWPKQMTCSICDKHAFDIHGEVK